MPLSFPITDPVLIFGLVMFIILVVPLLFTRLRVPGIVGLILAGAVVGPSALGVLARGETMRLLGTVGLLYLIFTAGLSIDLAQFTRLRRQSLIFGVLSFCIPQLLAFLVAYPVLGYDLPTTLLLGSIVGSHTLLAYPIVRRLGLTKSPAVTMTMGGTLVTDGVSLALLAVVVAAASGALGVVFWMSFVGIVLVYVVAVVYGLPRLGRWFFRTVRDQPDVEFVFLMAVVFLTAYLAGVIGLAPIIGAFLAGLSLNRLVPEASPLMARIQFAGNALFTPFFLISVGMLVDFGVLFGSGEVWVLAALFSLMVVMGKTAAALLARHLFGYGAAEGWTVAGLSIPQAAATLAVTIIGFEMGFFSEGAVNAVVLMILVTCILGPWLVERYGRRVALLEAQRPFEPFQAPQRILVPLANPETASRLIDVALLIRDPSSDQPVFPLAIAREGHGVEERVAEGERLLAHAVVHAAAADVPAIPVTRIDYNVAAGIVRAVRERLVTTLVIGWNGARSAQQRIFGSVLDQLLEETREMVLVSKLEHPPNTVQRVVVILPPHVEREEGFPLAARAVKLLAGQLGAQLLIVAAEERVAAVRPLWEQTRPQLPVAVEPLPTWKTLLPRLDALVNEHDLLVVCSVREGRPAWRPTLNALPRLLAARFAATSLLVLYPAERAPVAAAPGAGPPVGEEQPLLTAARITLGVEGTRSEDVLARMVAADAERSLATEEVVDALTAAAPEHLPELLPGVVLFHAHLPTLSEARLYVGISRAGLSLPNASEAVHVVFALLSPVAEPPEGHLRRLALVARMVHPPGIVAALRAAATPEEAHAELLRSAVAPVPS